MKVFISRDCTTDSDFRNILSANGIEVSGESLLEFSPLPFRLPADFDWIFFYSKNGVKYFFNSDSTISADTKIAALGDGTADVLMKLSGRNPDFCGDGTPEGTANAFRKIAAGKRILFVRAQESQKSVQLLLKEDINILELIVYKNAIKNHFPETDANILVFTSSMNALAYLKKYPLKNFQKILAIGKPTAETLKKMGISEIVMADRPDEKSLADAVLKIFKSNKP